MFEEHDRHIERNNVKSMICYVCSMAVPMAMEFLIDHHWINPTLKVMISIVTLGIVFLTAGNCFNALAERWKARKEVDRQNWQMVSMLLSSGAMTGRPQIN